MRGSLEQRFWNFVHFEPNSGCWLWGGCVNGWGYGQIRRGPKDAGTLIATRVSLEIHGRPVPDNLFALHTCDNPPCVNPDHLFIGDQKKNMEDCLSKGRFYRAPPGTKRNIKIREYCKHGHERTPENLMCGAGGYQICKACRSIQDARKRALWMSQGLNANGRPRSPRHASDGSLIPGQLSRRVRA